MKPTADQTGDLVPFGGASLDEQQDHERADLPPHEGATFDEDPPDIDKATPPPAEHAPSASTESSAGDQTADRSVPAAATTDDTAGMRAISEALASLDGRVREALQIARAKDEVIDRLHAENQALRAGELARAQMPLLRDLMSMHDDIERVIASGMVSVADLQFTRDLLIDVLARNGVQRFAPSVDADFDSSVHAAVEVEVAETPSHDRTVASVARAGFSRDDGLILRAAEVVVRRWREPEQSSGGSDDDAGMPPDGETTRTEESSDTNG